jgi:hypothetical protein
MEEKPMSEQESLRVITEMIQKAKGSFHEDGTSAILWGSVVGFCGIMSFLQKYFNFSIGFEVWNLALVAIIPQIWISIREKKRRTVKTHQEESMDAVWIVYSISISALILYFNVMPYATRYLMDASGESLFVTTNGVTKQLNTFIPSSNSLLILIYGIPTLTTGISRKFKPMLVGGILCYCFFVVSLFTPNTWDHLLNGFAGIVNWLIPGLILRKRYYEAKGNF